MIQDGALSLLSLLKMILYFIPAQPEANLENLG